MSTVQDEPVQDTRVESGPEPQPDAADGAPLEGQHLLELWSDRQEVHALPEILRPAEGLVAVGSGTVLRSGRLAQSRWLVVLTDRRLLCIKGRQAVTRKVIDMPISAVRSFATKGLLRKTLILETGYGTLRISGMKKKLAGEMVEGLGALMGSFGKDDKDRPTAIRRAELPDSNAPAAGSGSADAASAELVASLSEEVDRIGKDMDELRDKVAYLEGLVRASVESPPDDEPPRQL